MQALCEQAPAPASAAGAISRARRHLQRADHAEHTLQQRHHKVLAVEAQLQHAVAFFRWQICAGERDAVAQNREVEGHGDHGLLLVVGVDAGQQRHHRRAELCARALLRRKCVTVFILDHGNCAAHRVVDWLQSNEQHRPYDTCTCRMR